MEVFQSMALLAELVQCGGPIFTWCYDEKGNLLRSNCPDEAFLSGIFDLFGCKQQMMEYGTAHDTPITLGTALGILWAAAFEKENGKLKRAWVMGPVFYQDVSMRGIEQGLRYYSHLEISDINSETPPKVYDPTYTPAHDRHKVWMAEQGLLQMVRTGDLNYKQALSNSMTLSAGVPVHSDDALRQSKISVIVFTSLVCRAAIEGGLSPEEAYALGDSYIQTAESAKTLDDLNPLSLVMYDDFIRRVHKCRTNPKLSRPVQQCVDYIEMHLDQKIRAADLAAVVGYTEYYLTHKFKAETGLCINDYIKFAKIERAKVLLKSTDQTVQEIAAALCFSTRNYFSRIFQEVTGQTPVEYRGG